MRTQNDPARGDTIVLHHYEGSDESKTFYVYSESSLEGRRHLTLSDLSHTESAHFIEGVGNYSLFGYTRIPSWSIGGIVCVHKDGEHVFEHTTNFQYDVEDCVYLDSSYVKKHQYITWTEDLHFDISQSYAILHATATSGLPVRYISKDTTIGRISGDTVFLLRTGRADLQAIQDGDEDYHSTDMEYGFNILFVTDSTVSIAVAEKPVMRLYPNPTHSTVTIQGATEQIESVHIFDMAGRQVSAFGPAATFDISTPPAGSYIVRIQSAGHPDQHLRLIKE